MDGSIPAWVPPSCVIGHAMTDIDQDQSDMRQKDEPCEKLIPRMCEATRARWMFCVLYLSDQGSDSEEHLSRQAKLSSTTQILRLPTLDAAQMVNIRE